MKTKQLTKLTELSDKFFQVASEIITSCQLDNVSKFAPAILTIANLLKAETDALLRQITELERFVEEHKN